MLRTMLFWCFLLSFTSFVTVIPAAGASERWKITSENYDRIKNGMTTDEIIEIFGKPFNILAEPRTAGSEADQAEKTQIWIYRHHEVLVTIGFEQGRVINKCWAREHTELHADSSP